MTQSCNCLYRNWLYRGTGLATVLTIILTPANVSAQRGNPFRNNARIPQTRDVGSSTRGTKQAGPHTLNSGDAFDCETLFPGEPMIAPRPAGQGGGDEKPPSVTLGMPKLQDSGLLRALDEQIGDGTDSETQRMSELKDQLQELGDVFRQQRAAISLERQRAQQAAESARKAQELAAEARLSEEQARRLAEETRIRAEQARLEQQQRRLQTAVSEPPAETSVGCDPDNPTQPCESHGNEESQQPSLVDILPPSPLPITDAPVDRLALADNLFGAGENRLALGIYSQLLKQRNSKSDMGWLHLQMANCHRRLEETPDAEKHYRIVAGMKNAGFFAKSARWWLGSLKKRQEMKQRLANWKQTLAMAESEINK